MAVAQLHYLLFRSFWIDTCICHFAATLFLLFLGLYYFINSDPLWSSKRSSLINMCLAYLMPWNVNKPYWFIQKHFAIVSLNRICIPILMFDYNFSLLFLLRFCQTHSLSRLLIILPKQYYQLPVTFAEEI